MTKPKILPIIISFIIGIILSSLGAVYFSSKAVKKIHKGYSLLLEGKLSQALKSYKQAQRLWPVLLYDSETNSLIKQAEKANKKAQVINIYMKKNASELEIQSLIKDIKVINGVKEIRYISKEDAFNKYKELNKDDPELIKLVAPDLIPASLEIYLNDLLAKDKIIQLAKSKDFVENIEPTF